MIRVSELKLPLDGTKEQLKKKAARVFPACPRPSASCTQCQAQEPAFSRPPVSCFHPPAKRLPYTHNEYHPFRPALSEGFGGNGGGGRAGGNPLGRKAAYRHRPPAGRCTEYPRKNHCAGRRINASPRFCRIRQAVIGRRQVFRRRAVLRPVYHFLRVLNAHALPRWRECISSGIWRRRLFGRAAEAMPLRFKGLAHSLPYFVSHFSEYTAKIAAGLSKSVS